MQNDSPPKSSFWKRWYSRLLFIAVLISVSWYIITSFNDFTEFDYHLDWTYLFLSFLFTVAAYLLQLIIWFFLARSFGINLSFLNAANAWSLSQLGKYLPGKIGLFLVRMDAHHEVPKRAVAVATGVEFITAMAASCLLVLAAAPFMRGTTSSYIFWSAAGLACLLLLSLYPPILKILSAWAFRMMKRPPLDNLPSYGFLLKLVAANMLVGIPYGLGLFFAYNCFYPIGWNYFLIITGIYYAAALVGVAAIFAPAGIGVREGIVFLILPALISKPVVIFATLLTRIIITIVEIFLAGLFFALTHNRVTHTKDNADELKGKV
jgi:glycosyltransferase 2 family protein